MGIDGINEAGLVKLNSTNPDDMQTLVYSSGNMEDGDHQIWGTIETLEKHGVIEVHYFEWVAPLTLMCPRLVCRPHHRFQDRKFVRTGFRPALVWAKCDKCTQRSAHCGQYQPRHHI